MTCFILKYTISNVFKVFAILLRWYCDGNGIDNGFVDLEKSYTPVACLVCFSYQTVKSFITY